MTKAAVLEISNGDSHLSLLVELLLQKAHRFLPDDLGSLLSQWQIYGAKHYTKTA